MAKIYNLDSDSSILDELSSCIRNREINQKFLYINNWAKLYYKEKTSNQVYNKETLTNKDFLDFFEKNQLHYDGKSTMISLWCWNSATEAYLYRNFDLSNIKFLWVDSSESMLLESVKNFKDLDIDKQFMKADFSTREFRLELSQLTKWKWNRIFVFLSNTFWNISHTNIIDILWNLLHKWEQIWLDVRVRKWLTVQDDLKISEVFSQDLEREDFQNILVNVFHDYGVPKENLKLKMKTIKTHTLWALKFIFSYKFLKKSHVNIKWEKLILLPDEEVKVQQIYAYDPEWLCNFFKEHWFKVIDSHTKGYRGQFLFEKI